jgi:hypothetical protein
VSERLTLGRGGRAPEPGARPQANTPPGHRALVAIIVMTCVVLGFAAAVAFWMYWLQGSLPT